MDEDEDYEEGSDISGDLEISDDELRRLEEEEERDQDELD